MTDTAISGLQDGGAVLSTDEFPSERTGANKKETGAQLKDFCRSRLDVALDGLSSSNLRVSPQCQPIRTAAGVWYEIFLATTGALLFWKKSTNYGVSWSVPIAISATVVRGVACWFDKWTPGDTGTLIHIAFFETTNNDVIYRSLDTASDTLGTELTALAATSVISGSGCIAVTKSRGNRILIGYDIDAGTEIGFLKSNDFPVTAFTAKDNTAGIENGGGSGDRFMLFPGNYADANDIDMVYQDVSADELSVKTYDDSANNWTGVSAETTISGAGGLVDVALSVSSPHFSAAVRNSDGHLIIVWWTAQDTLNADLKCSDWNGAGSLTAKTDVVLNSVDDQAMCGIGIDTTADALYVFYFGKSDGSETAYTSLNLYYKISTDGGTTWGSETLLTLYARASSYLAVCPESVGGEFVVHWISTINSDLVLFNSALT